MIVVADSSPIHLLVRIELIDLLPMLFGKIQIPSMVGFELRHTDSAVVRDFIATSPEWIVISDPNLIERIPTIDPGEEAAISLAREVRADALLIDDKPGRNAAAARGIPIIGTIGVLERAAEQGFCNLEATFQAIRKTDFRITERLLQEALTRHRTRRQTE